MNTRQGSIHLFKFAGVNVFLHWSWFLVAAFEVGGRSRSYSSVGWNLAEYVALFLIVLVHEYGHALACRQVGGTANRIVLWPLGGIAYVDPPQRPGATLWSIAAGPLVNVAFIPVLALAGAAVRSMGWAVAMPNAYGLLRSIWWINLVLLIFNVLPIYPLDGGQILRSLLWFVTGKARSLMIATAVGFAGVAGLILLAFWSQSVWLGILSVFILMNSWQGMQQARVLGRIAKLPRRAGFACPSCHAAPPIGPMWRCMQCSEPFDTFQTHAVCPHCSAAFPVTRCVDCNQQSPVAAWMPGEVAATSAN